MIIALDERTLNQNIMSDGLIAGSGAGDIILIQDVSREAYDDSKYSLLPDKTVLHAEPSFQSVKSPSKSIIHKVMVSDEILVNGVQIPCKKSFITFIREATSGKKKVTFVCQGTRKLDSANADNKVVLDTISEYLGYRSFTVEALEYIDGTNSLNFIIFDRGYKADFSHIFARKDRTLRGIKEYTQEEISNWSETEFGLLCIHMLRQYSLTWLTKLLTDNRYCAKRFGAKVLSDVNEVDFLEEPIIIDGKKFFVRNKWSPTTRSAFFNWLLDRISEKSNDVFDITRTDEVKALRIPDCVNGIDYNHNQIEIAYSVSGKNIKDFIYGQNVYQRDNVVLVDEQVTRLLSYSFYFVKYMKEQSIILNKEKTTILPSKEKEVLDLIRKGEL